MSKRKLNAGICESVIQQLFGNSIVTMSELLYQGVCNIIKLMVVNQAKDDTVPVFDSMDTVMQEHLQQIINIDQGHDYRLIHLISALYDMFKNHHHSYNQQRCIYSIIDAVHHKYIRKTLTEDHCVLEDIIENSKVHPMIYSYILSDVCTELEARLGDNVSDVVKFAMVVLVVTILQFWTDLTGYRKKFDTASFFNKCLWSQFYVSLFRGYLLKIKTEGLHMAVNAPRYAVV